MIEEEGAEDTYDQLVQKSRKVYKTRKFVERLLSIFEIIPAMYIVSIWW
jgi:hypothetical protein